MIRPTEKPDDNREKRKMTVSYLGLRRVTLEQLMADITPENVHQEVDTHQAVGNEVW